MAINAGPTTYSQAKRGIVQDGLVLNLDAAVDTSYPGDGTTWYDLEGSNSGTLTNGPTFDRGEGGSIVFDGSDDYVNFGSQTWDISTNLTIDFFIKFNTLNSAAYYTMFSFGGFISNGWLFQINGQNNKLRFAWGATDIFDGPIYTTTNVWVYLCCVVDSGTPTYIYVNNTSYTPSRTSGSSSFNISGAQNVDIARRTDSTSQYIDGQISNLRVYNRALSAEEVLKNYNATKWRFQ
jgi:hypothetical protein